MNTGGLGTGLLEIAMALLGIALVALLVNNASKAATLVQAGTQGFGNLLQIVTLQNGMGFQQNNF